MTIGRQLNVVLGPGWAPGLAGLGFLAELEASGAAVHRVVGANTGALVGALWALGRDLLQSARILAALPWPRYQIARDLGESDPLLNALQVLTEDAAFADAPRSFTVLATELETGEARAIAAGSLATAVRGSMAVPGLFEPLTIAASTLADGGGHAFRWWENRLASDSVGIYVQPAGARSASAGGVDFPDLSRRIATYASRTWPEPAPRVDGYVGVAGGVGGLLDFDAALEWAKRGQIAARRWLRGEAGEGARA